MKVLSLCDGIAGARQALKELNIKGNNVISNTQIYKCLGNSFTVPVIKHILQHLTKTK